MVQQKPKPKTRRTKTKHDENKKSIALEPLNDRQGEYISALNSSDLVVVFGPAGTGKTYVVSTYAANLYHTKAVNKIVITRPHVAVGQPLGALPGAHPVGGVR